MVVGLLGRNKRQARLRAPSTRYGALRHVVQRLASKRRNKVIAHYGPDIL
jgi:hypothetical protein